MVLKKITYKLSITIFFKIRSYLVVFIVLLLEIMRTLILIFIPLFVQAQDVTIGSWKDYQSYKSASYVSKGDGRIYCVTSGALFYINKDDYSINRLSKVSGLSDVGIKHVKHSYDLNVTVITYENCNIDIIKNNSVINISDIKRKEISEEKK